MTSDKFRKLSETNPFSYPVGTLDTTDPLYPPQYDLALKWMRDISGRSASLDFWARGNYMRRLLQMSKQATRQLIVPVQSVDEIRWAYRRLALLGMPVEFLWQGELSAPMKIMHLHPGGEDDIWDAGWGYIAALGTQFKIRRRSWAAIIGFARLMPEKVPSWIVDEAPDAFINGEVFITPSELVGVPNSEPEMRAAFEELLHAVPIHCDPAAEAMLNIELPVLDGLKASDFTKLLRDHIIELERLRFAFRKLVLADAAQDFQSLVDELNYETSELTLADRYQSFRARITRAGGMIGTSAAAVGAAVGATTGSVLAAVAAAGGSVATAGLCELLRDRAEHELDARRNPFFLLWKLGAQTGTSFRKTSPASHNYQRRIAAPPSTTDGYFHWLAPPTAGVSFAAVRKDGTV